MGRESRNSSSKGGLVSHRSHLHVLDLINVGLGSVNMKRLKNSQFGHLFPFPRLRFQGQLYNILLRHLDKNSSDHNILTFIIGGRSLDFGAREFALITGLSFGGFYQPPSESELHRAYFRGRFSVTLVDVIQAFNIECRSTGGNSLNSLKLACLLIVYGVFLTLGGSQNHVDMSFFHLIDNVESFLCFPWGIIAYNSLVMRTHRARDLLESLIQRGKCITLDANCFVLALQIWAYEVIPIVGRNCGSRVFGAERDFPRLRRWEALNPIKFDKLQVFFANLNAESLMPMIPSENEEREITTLHQSSFGKELHFLTNKSNDTSLNGIASKHSALCVQSRALQQTVEVDEISLLKRRVSVLENVIQSSNKLSVDIKRVDKKSPKRLRSHVLPVDLPVVDHKMKNHEMGAATRVVASSNTKHSSKSVSKYDPNERGMLTEWLDDFTKWRNSNHASLLIPCRKVGIVGSSWFQPLWDRRGWLTTSHIDALMTLLLVTSNNDPARFQSDWSALEMYCWDALCGDNMVTLRERVGPFVVGHQPETRGLHWAFARKVYGVGHVNGNHWLSYELDFDARMVTVFDSMSEVSDWGTSKNLFNIVCRNLDKVCADNHVWRIKGDIDFGKKWRVQRFNHPPQQKNTFDCGVMAIKFIECLISGNSVTMLDGDRCGFFRQYYCAKLLRISEIDPEINLCL